MFSFGGSRSRSRSESEARSFIDPSQQPHLNNIRNQASVLSMGGMPVEGVASINNRLSSGIGAQFQGGGAIAGAGAGMMGFGSGIMNQGYGAANNFIQGAAGTNPSGFVEGGMDAGRMFAQGGSQANIAQGSGAATGTAREMANQAFGVTGAQSAGTMNQGFDQSNVANYMNNDVLSGQIDAASRDVMRNLQENQLTGNAAMAAGSGNSGSSRRAVMDAIATRGAADRVGDIAANMRGQAYNTGLGIEANRASQNAQLGQQNQQFNASNQQQANMFSAGAANQLLGQGFNIGANQLESNLQREQQGNQFNTGQFNQNMQFGANMGMDANRMALQNQQFGANLGLQMGGQGMAGMQSGANIMTSGINQQIAAGNFQRDYEQQLLNNQFQQAMSPYNALNFYNQIVGAPTVLNEASSSSRGRSSGINFGFGG